ncbi:MAG: DUF6335 family protein [Coleofasciculus sp. C1-SOL-03]|jgi:hypothetical protein|uniref:DUF6335 family protein n=1 Tax=Coleofasciculus sp. C1-SOL-03 TaxID=3069522 RepID=UPI0032F8C836
MEPEKINQSQSKPASESDQSQETHEIELTYRGLSDRNTADGRLIEESRNRMASGEPTTGDVDANLYQAKVGGEEAVGGLTPTPDQNVTQEMERAVGVEGAQKEPVQVTDKLEQRDEQRWELDPKSSEDYSQHGN